MSKLVPREQNWYLYVDFDNEINERKKFTISRYKEGFIEISNVKFQYLNKLMNSEKIHLNIIHQNDFNTKKVWY